METSTSGSLIPIHEARPAAPDPYRTLIGFYSKHKLRWRDCRSSACPQHLTEGCYLPAASSDGLPALFHTVGCQKDETAQLRELVVLSGRIQRQK